MLPELFSVGSTMQEDFGFLNVNNCYSEKATTSNTNPNELIDLESTNASTYNKTTLQPSKIKSEDSPDINKWPFNYGINFLRTSDDPMISSVNQEIDNHDNELLRSDSTSTDTPTTPSFETTSPSQQSLKSKFQVSRMSESHTTRTQRSTTKTRRKGPMKLRFHHQAIPAEYLNHYESQQNQLQVQENLRQQQQQQSIPPKKKQNTKLPATAPPPVAEKPNIDTKINNESIIYWLQNILETQNSDEVKQLPKVRNIPIEVPPTTSKTQCLKDLPYMGEMTLENMKPRRGRKPKKADICHLIYKNYGTIVPGSAASTATTTIATSTNIKKPAEHLKKKSPTLQLKKVKENESKLNDNSTTKSTKTATKLSQNEPLNLCIRETKFQVEDSSILISDDNEDSNGLGPPPTRAKAMIDPAETDSIDLEFSSTIPSLISPLDLSGDLPATSREFFRTTNVTPPLSSSTSTPTTPSLSGAPPGYVYWPSAGLFIHPMAFYYQKMMDGRMTNDSSTSSSNSSISSMFNNDANTLWEQNMSSLQTETSSTNPTNEVSICKFKFTGGAKPSLQEKKILSVDAGGNFRYYSGTGDKSMRGYEFFPRESLRQSSLASGSHTNAFLNAASEKIPLDLLPPITVDLNNKLLNLTTDVDTSKILDNNNFTIEPENVQMRIDSEEDRVNRRKKSSNRSIQRAKLEKTFKEKGFLIQTQQLQSAEGATYCKFRQLRKFTRYLFRSWKDYLPTDENGTQSHEPESSVARCPASSAS
ncbi:CLUMA_CG004125, isoform B [Clunio marinus]|uniref:CLUMA_CG004125, isoform B n=1 Tax=Clunio marinus TaxID=568069 RepID=A0A1J1HRA2_9DIPT|nr:CLUMA_CG004125, isoform B [Clunio marinus]